MDSLSNPLAINQNKSKADFDNIKSDYFLPKIFEYIIKYKALKILRYNKKLQRKLKLDINSYKEYSQKYSSIEIELIPFDNEYGKFISSKNKEYYHIYFDDEKEEIKRYSLNEGEKVKKIKIILEHQIKSFSGLFSICFCIKSINFKKFYRNDITDMSRMFNASSFEEINFSNFNTDNVKYMKSMFAACQVKKLDLSKFNTINVTNMLGMLDSCRALEELNISNFNNSNLKDMRYMFAGCSSLKELKLPDSFTINDPDMGSAFDGISDELKKKISEQDKNIKFFVAMNNY